MKRIIEITIDLKNKVYNELILKQMDTTVIKVKLLDNGIVADLTSQTVDILFTKPNESIVQQLSSNIDLENGIATIPLKEDCVRDFGKAKMEIEVKNTYSEIISSFYIPIIIEKTSKGNITSKDTPNYFEELTDLSNNLTELIDNVKKEETTRKNNETDRTTAENKRKEAEAVREKAYEEIREYIDTNSVLIQSANVTVNTEYEKETEFELPINYTVGNNHLKLFWEGNLLEEGENGNYVEVGEPGQSSNKVKFGWNLEIGETLLIEVRGIAK